MILRCRVYEMVELADFRPLDMPIRSAHPALPSPPKFSFFGGDPLKTDPLSQLEAWIVHTGLRILGIATFLAFFGWSLWHLARMFV
jgi:hypothetical protein